MFHGAESAPVSEENAEGSGVKRRPRKEEPSVVVDPSYLEEIKSAKRKREPEPSVVVDPSYLEEIKSAKRKPEDEISDARKELKFIDDSEKEIIARQEALRKELKKHGISSTVQIDAELAEMGPELRKESMGLKPEFRYRMKKIGLRLLGIERAPEVKKLLKKYVDIENEMNAEIHSRAEAERRLMQAEKEAHRLVTVSDRPEAGDVSENLQTIIALKNIREEIDDAIGEMTAMEELTESELSGEMFGDKKTNFARRIRALEEVGGGEAFDGALEEAEEALMRYVVRVHERQRAFEKQARTAGKGNARPLSVIVGRGESRHGSYGTPMGSARRIVKLAKQEQEDTRLHREASEKQEAAAMPEKVNKEVDVYRSVAWRKNLIDKINANEDARQAMHGVYEAFKHKVLEKLADEESFDFRTGSPDPALDYALNLFRYYAQRPDGKGYFYTPEKRKAAHEEIMDADALLGKNWDPEHFAARAVRALSSGKRTIESVKDRQQSEETVEVEEEKKEIKKAKGVPGVPPEVFKALDEDLKTEPVAIAYAYRLMHSPKGRAMWKEKLIDKIAKRVRAENMREIAERVYFALAEKRSNVIPFPNKSKAIGDNSFVVEGRVSGEDVTLPTPEDGVAWKRVQPFESEQEKEVARNEINGLLKNLEKNEEQEYKDILFKYGWSKNLSPADALLRLFELTVLARPGVRKRMMRADLDEAWGMLKVADQTNGQEPGSASTAPESLKNKTKGKWEGIAEIRARVRSVSGSTDRLSILDRATRGMKGRSLAERINALYRTYREAEDVGAKRDLFSRVNDARRALSLEAFETPKELVRMPKSGTSQS
jgi:hypothetical protein